jgi:hypothetical protein
MWMNVTTPHILKTPRLLTYLERRGSIKDAIKTRSRLGQSADRSWIFPE